MAVCFQISFETVEEDMSLLTDYMEECIMIDKRTSDDGMGGYITERVEGAHFDAAVVLNNSLEARTAEKAGVTALYTVTTRKSINLQYHDVFRRVSDSKIFRVTSDGDDKKTPKGATLNMRQVSAEEWEIPRDEQISSDQ